MVKIKDLKSIYEYLLEKYDKWCLASKKAEKARIEQSVCDFMVNIDDALYPEFNEGRGSGLCCSQFFKDDILRCISILEDKLETLH